MTQEELNKVLERHLHWLRKDCAGWENMRAILDGENLDRLDLGGASLNGASLYKTSLEMAFLDEASLNGALLDEASLYKASLNGASLNGASLKGTSLDGASLNYASLYKTSFERTSLEGASFYKASLEGNSFYKASFNGTSFYEASLNEAIDMPFIPFSCPETGAFIGWKKAHGKIIKLEIPADAKRCSSASEKCRCDKAKVLEIQEIDGRISSINKIQSDFDRDFIYEVGKTVSVKDYCDDRWKDCSQGIHFFINRQSAVECR